MATTVKQKLLSYQMDDNGILDLNPNTCDILDPVGLGVAVVGTPNTVFKQN